ncbi:hypothetical protein GCM10022251_67750 [Phytohabitans flavus]|uniref:Uncharacterized protein n=1 Tax=Phytohabitans flavus TaxID=1076124 RepID=A0A6F8Y516_9ACTN|nr:hypothetical protein Pflav_075950 [Phytohabitans flavus]
MLRAQPVQLEVAQVRDQVRAEVAGIGAAGVLVHRSDGQPPLQIHVKRGRPIQGPASVQAAADRVHRRQPPAIAGGLEQPETSVAAAGSLAARRSCASASSRTASASWWVR